MKSNFNRILLTSNSNEKKDDDDYLFKNEIRVLGGQKNGYTRFQNYIVIVLDAVFPYSDCYRNISPASYPIKI